MVKNKPLIDHRPTNFMNLHLYFKRFTYNFKLPLVPLKGIFGKQVLIRLFITP